MVTKQSALPWSVRLFGRAKTGQRDQSATKHDVKMIGQSAFAVLHIPGTGHTTPASFSAMTAQGFARNPIVYRCVRMICEAAASAPWLGYERDKETSTHPALELIERPNGQQTRQEFLEALMTNLLLSGNAYVEHVEPVPGRHRFFVVRSDIVEVVADEAGWGSAIKVTRNGKKRLLSLGDGASIGDALHMKLIDPLSDTYGQSPLQAALTALDVHNSAASWNKSLLDNAARPSGALIYAPADNSSMTPEQFDI